MRKGLLIFLALLSCVSFSEAQNSEGARLQARANVVGYDDEDAIMKSAYRESPYYMTLSGRWDQKETDSSRIYSREIEVEKYWKDYRVSLNVRCGYACRVLLNGKVVGYGDDSRHWNEFDLNGFLKYGKNNTLAIEALKQPVGALLENQYQTIGLYDEPYFLFKNDPNIADMTLVADYDAATATGSLSVDATVFNSRKKGRYYLEVEIWDPQGHTFDRMGRWVVFDKKSEVLVDMSRSWGNVFPWTAETPNLYTVVLRLRDEEMEEEEVVGARFGFRRVEVNEGLLKINGTPVTLKGVCVADNATDRQHLLALIQNLKANNVNAVRTERISPAAPIFYELCDEYGLYVICDANLFPASSQQRAVATDKDFIPLFERRVENLYGKYKNYTSIIAWSLGDTRDNGVCMGAAYKRLKTIEKNRLVIFAGAEFSSNTDIVAFLHPDQQQLRQATSKVGDRPFLILAAGEKDYDKVWDKVVNTRTLQGVFLDGLSSRILSELKNLYSPFDIHIAKKTIDDVEFTVYNRNDFADFSQYLLDYTIYTNLRSSITAGDLPVAIRGGGVEAVKLRVPPVELQAGEELFVRFDLTRRQKAGIRQSSLGNNLGTLVFPLSDKAGKKKILDVGGQMIGVTYETLDGRERCRVHTPYGMAFNLAEGTLEWFTAGMGSMPVDSLTLFFENHRNWKPLLVALQSDRPAPGVYVIDAMFRYYTRPERSDEGRLGTLMCDVRQTYTVFATGDMVVDYTIAPSDHLRETLVPRVEIAHSFGENDTLSWFGLDRETPYGQHRSAIPGTYRETLPHGMIRDENRWCAINDSAYKGLFVDVPDTHFTFMASTHVLWITPYIANPSKPSFRLHLRGFSPKVYNICSTYINEEQFHKQDQGGERIEDFIGTTYPQVSTGMLEPPVITVTEARFSAPLTVTITSPSKGDIRYTLDGSDPTETSPLYKGPITLTTTTVVKARAFGKGVPPSFTATRKFNYDYIISTTFSRKPNTPFNVGTDTILFDGEKGVVSDLQHGWLGFSGSGVTATVKLAKQVDVENLTLRFAHVPDNWAFAPAHITVTLSSDGEHYTDTVEVAMPFDPTAIEENIPREVEIKVPVGRDNVAFMKVEVDAISAVPDWHRAKGLKPWILMDEIEVSEKIKMKNDN